MSTKTRYKDKGLHVGGPWTAKSYRSTTGLFEFDLAGVEPDVHKGSISESITTTAIPNTEVRECLHVKTDKTIFSHPVTSYTTGYGYSRVDVTGPRQYLAIVGRGAPNIGHEHLVVTYPKTRDALVAEARSAFYDVNETDNLLNILEAGQTLNSLVSLGQLLTRIRRSRYEIIDSFKPNYASRNKLKSLDVSNMFLAWSFGFAPLIADAKKIAQALPRLRGNLRRLAKQSARPVSVVRSCQGDISLNLAGFSEHWAPGDTPDIFHWWSERFSNVRRPRRVGGIHGTRSVEYKTAGFQEIDYLLSRYIATGPISLAWEKVKFSFVVDWFANLTGVVDQLDNVLTGHRKKITRSWSSEGYDVICSVKSHGFTDTEFPGIDGSDVAQYELQYYHRKPEPVDYSVTWSGRFGKKQTALSVALLHQMAANLKKR